MTQAPRKGVDMISRGVKQRTMSGIATFVTLRLADPFIQYALLYGPSRSVEDNSDFEPKERTSLITGRSILLAMSVISMLKQNYHMLFVMQEDMTPRAAAIIGAVNFLLNSMNSLLFLRKSRKHSIWLALGSKLVPVRVALGSILFAVGIVFEWLSEVQRAAWKAKTENRGQVYARGLFSLSRHINYFGYTLWRSGYTLAGGGGLWSAIVAGFFVYDFNWRGIPILQRYMKEKYGEKSNWHKQVVPYKFVPFVW
ncbi:hypothetical protein K470DRAFT_254222 [Piedraia hortae CBS 480.64]|uniref:Steroid 5-alpha reductase C-terminal domain-containing protein n=1 Tax=Piedraia hortae CBS 480.64 TaxID=1314780 RepID=A0A6A7CAW7_9PEZI|nr:hypothetical protein K470DRAFT_254222 [Piedraia hortae CBS 480.64]